MLTKETQTYKQWSVRQKAGNWSSPNVRLFIPVAHFERFRLSAFAESPSLHHSACFIAHRARIASPIKCNVM